MSPFLLQGVITAGIQPLKTLFFDIFPLSQKDSGRIKPLKTFKLSSSYVDLKRTGASRITCMFLFQALAGKLRQDAG
jgi:hypothetical protein